MKYVFIVHSHTLFLTSLGAIEYKHISYKDVIFLFTRNYNSSLVNRESTCIRGENLYDQCNNIYYSSNRRFINNGLKSVDSSISRIVNGSFELFVPHLSDPLFQILYTHHDCKKVSFVQEGAITAKDYFCVTQSFYAKWKRKLRLLIRYGSIRFYCDLRYWYQDGVLQKQNSLDAYVVYENFFGPMPCVQHVVEWPKWNKGLPEVINGPVFIFDGFVKNGMASLDYYLSQCREMINRFHGNNNFLKFHPAQNMVEQERIKEFFQEMKVPFCELDSTIPFEFYIIGERKMTLIGMGSSLLYFAKKRGHNVICCDSWMMGSLAYKRNHDRGFPLFHEFFEDVREIKK